jgi:tRNA A-37 threonylcarbamoyl transferase component Bud32
LAEFELVVRHKTLPAKIGLSVLIVTMPVWSIALPFLLGSFIGTILYSIFHPAEAPIVLNPIIEIAVISFLAVVPAIAILLSAICEDDRILIGKDGISFPLAMLPRLGLKRDRRWADLKAAQIFYANQSNLTKGQLQLFFRDGPAVALNLNLIEHASLEQFFLALELWAKNCERSPELLAYQNNLQNESRGLGLTTYTQIWEEELGRRFSATSFVPLEPNQYLADKTLRIVRQLAFGGLSAIYLAQKNEKDLVIVKEAVVPANADPQSIAKAVEMFAREARFLLRLEHPQIARVLDHFQEENRSYLILEYIPGQDLRQLVKQNGRQNRALVLEWFKQLSLILDYLHSQKPPIIHRDLTPDNIVLKDEDKITLIDFGAANEFVGTATGTMVGKQSYIAPEQLRGRATPASDIYALGCTIYFLLTGIEPEALSESHPREICPQVDLALDQLVARCTAMDESERPASSLDLCRLIEALQAAGEESVATQGQAL